MRETQMSIAEISYIYSSPYYCDMDAKNLEDNYFDIFSISRERTTKYLRVGWIHKIQNDW